MITDESRGFFPERLQRDDEMPVVPELKLRVGARFLYPRVGVMEVEGIDYEKQTAALKHCPGAWPEGLPVLNGDGQDWVMIRKEADPVSGRTLWSERDVASVCWKELEWE